MLWILIICCLHVGEGQVQPGHPESKPHDYQELVDLFQHVFSESFLQFEGHYQDRPQQLNGRVQVTLATSFQLSPSGRVSYPDDSTKLCSMELNGVSIVIHNIDKDIMVRMASCRLLLQFSIVNQTGVSIRPEAVIVFGCSGTTLGDGTVPTWAAEVPHGLSELMQRTADGYLTRHYNSTDFFTHPYLDVSGTSFEEFHDVLDTVMVIA